MLGNIIHDIIEHHLSRVHAANGQVIGNIGQRVGFEFNIRLDATTIAHLAPVPCIKHTRETVGNMFLIASTIMLVVDGLYAAAAGNVVFAGREFHLPIIRDVHRSLYQTFAISACTQHQGTIEVLQTATGDFAGRCGVVVNEHHHGHHRV